MDFGKRTINEWTEPDVSHHLKVDAIYLGRVHNIAIETTDMEEIRFICEVCR